MIHQAKEAIHVFSLTRRYFGLKRSFDYLLRLPKAVRNDALIDAFASLKAVQTMPDGTKLSWAAPHPIFIEEIIERKCYTPNSAFDIQPNDIILDLGANVGTFTVYAGIKARDGKVIAVEPNPKLFRYLEMNIAENALNNVKALNALVSSADGKLPFYSIERGGSIKPSYSSKSNCQEITSLTIPSIIQLNSLEHVDFLKMDIEGAEFDVFSEASFLQQTDKIAMEIHPSYGNLNDITEKPISNGFQVTVKPAYLDERLQYLYARKN